VVNIAASKLFLYEVFPSETIWSDEFKKDLQFVQVDSTVSKKPALDFSLCDFSYSDIAEAKRFILQAKRLGRFPSNT
jgi:hypothetical protein